MDHVGGKSLSFFERMAEKALFRIATLKADECPACLYESEAARACTSRGDSTPWPSEGDVPVCKYAARDALERQERERVQIRLNRLTAAGCADPRMLRLIPKATQPPMPEARRDGAQLAMAAAEDFIADRSRQTLVLCGGTGAGKSFAAAWVMAREGGFWMAATDANSFEGWDLARPRAEQAPLLVVDDLGQERDSGDRGAGTALLTPLLTTRIDRGLRTICTTNIAPANLAGRYGDRWVSRLRQSGGAYWVGDVDLRGLA